VARVVADQPDALGVGVGAFEPRGGADGRNGAQVLSAAATFGSLVDGGFAPPENVTPCDWRQLRYAVNWLLLNPPPAAAG
jgi:hypothetical protein